MKQLLSPFRYLKVAGKQLRKAGDILRKNPNFNKYGTWLWRAIDLAGLSIFAWEIMKSDDSSGSDDVTSQEVMTELLMPPAVILAIHSSYDDSVAVSQGFSNAGLSLMNSKKDAPTIRGFGYISCASYISKVNADQMLYSLPDLKVTLSSLSGVLDDAREMEASKSTIDQLITMATADSMDPTIQKNIDFLCYTLSGFVALRNPTNSSNTSHLKLS